MGIQVKEMNLLFDIASETAPDIDGLTYIPAFISRDDETALLKHIDCVPCFADTIASLSPGSAAIMQFTHRKNGGREELYLKERSLIVLSGPARYEWQHAIPSRKSDIVNGCKVERARRVSLTFRNVIINSA